MLDFRDVLFIRLHGCTLYSSPYRCGQNETNLFACDMLPITTCMTAMCLQAKAKKADSRGGTPSSNDETAPLSSRPRANSYGGENASIISNAPSSSQFNGASDSRHSADVFQPMESDTLKLNLDKVLTALH